METIGYVLADDCSTSGITEIPGKKAVTEGSLDGTAVSSKEIPPLEKV